jgi:hypothetical protein
MKNFILIFAMLLLPAAGFAQSGTTGSLNWALADGTLTISGTGAMPDYSYDDTRPWGSSSENITAVIIESGVTYIGDFAFTGCTGLTSVNGLNHDLLDKRIHPFGLQIQMDGRKQAEFRDCSKKRGVTQKA